MPEAFSRAELVGERLPLPGYRAEFSATQWSIGGQESWKLERRQHFREPGFESWEAFARGDWERSLQLIEQERDFLAEFSARAAGLSIGLYRVRVVEQPIGPYLQWELHLLRVRAECGERIRVATEDLVRGLESPGFLPELVTLGRERLYHVLYDDSGSLTGAVRVTNPRVVARATDLTRSLYEQGEDLTGFFDRAVAPLPPPRVNQAGAG
jgi:hypothetical protein